jgi:DNA-directed RNA polymerase beta subunit
MMLEEVAKRRIIEDPRKIRAAIHKRVMDAIRAKFPIQGREYTAKLLNLEVKFEDLSHAAQRDLLTSHQNASDKVYADIEIVKNDTGASVTTLKHKLILNIPYYTNRYTLMLDGNEYSVVNQMRTKSGVYTRKRGNEELESSFNLEKGANFKLSMQPSSGIFRVSILNSVLPAVAIIKILGGTSADVAKYIGTELADHNFAELTPSQMERTRDTLYNKLVRYRSQNSEDTKHVSASEKDTAIRAYFAGTKLDPETTNITLGSPSYSVSAVTIMQAMKKVLMVFNAKEDFDDRDMLEFQKVYSVEDLLSEVITKNKDIVHKFKQKLDKFQGDPEEAKKIFAADIITGPVQNFITNSSLARLPAQINPIEFVDSASIITRLGEGAISSERAVPFETRGVNYSYMGTIDPIAAPESSKVGIDVHCTLGAMKGEDNEFYKSVLNCKTGQTENKRIIDLYDKYVGFPDPGHKKDKLPDDDMAAIYRGKLVHVPRKNLDYQIASPHDLATVTVNSLPFMPANQGNRLLMGAKHVQQALPLKEPEKRLVKASMPKGYTYNGVEMKSTVDMLGKWTLPRSPVDGVVSKIADDYIYIKDSSGKEHQVDYENNVPLSTKTFLNNDITVKVGDTVTKDQPLAGSNFSKDGELTMGRNLTVAYMPYEGMNHEDGLIVSESCANKMTSVHADKVTLYVTKTMTLSKSKFAAAFPTKYTTAQLAKLDASGMAKKGVVLEQGDPVILAMEDNSSSRINQVLGMLHKSLRHPFRDCSEVYDGAFPATVVTTASTNSLKTVVLKIEKPLQIGDKLAGSYGNKGTCAKILPDDQMPRDESGNPVDLVFSSVGVISRINAGQILESSLGKVAKKTGIPYEIENYSKDDCVKFVKEELKKHGVKDKETVTDPITGKKIPNIFVGVQHYHKLFKTTDTNFAARGVEGGYDQDEAPTGSGFHGPKALGNMEVNALMAHNARTLLREGTILRSSKNLDFWKEFQSGGNPKMPTEKKTFNRFVSILKQAGINVKKEGDVLTAMPLTDKDTLSMSSGEIKDGLMLNAKNLKPEDGGLFDVNLTGGTSGSKWTHVKLVEPVVNPVFEDAVKSILKVDTKQLDDMKIKEGGQAIRDALNKLDVEQELKAEEDKIFGGKVGRGELDKSVKRVKFLRTLKDMDVKAGDAYVMSVVPVTPPVVRPIVIGISGDVMHNDANDLYKELIIQNNSFAKTKNSDNPTDMEITDNRKALNDRMSELVGTAVPVNPKMRNRRVRGALAFLSGDVPKEGYFQSKVIYGKMNLTGRATISPDTSLGLDEVGLPEKAAWEMYKPFIVRKLSQMGYSPLNAQQAIEEHSPVATKILHDEMEYRPVIVNRAPTLWRHGILAAKPLLRDGKNLRINSLWEKGLNADYDGDAMQIHLPVTEEAVAEAKSFLPSKQLFSDKKKGDLLMAPTNEPIIGLYQATKNIANGKATGNGKVHKYKNVDEAWKDYYAGKLKMTDFVEIG